MLYLFLVLICVTRPSVSNNIANNAQYHLNYYFELLVATVYNKKTFLNAEKQKKRDKNTICKTCVYVYDGNTV